MAVLSVGREGLFLTIVTDDGTLKRQLIYADMVSSVVTDGNFRVLQMYRNSVGDIIVTYQDANGVEQSMTIPAASAGDMLKSIYDPDDDGVIDLAQLDADIAAHIAASGEVHGLGLLDGSVAGTQDISIAIQAHKLVSSGVHGAGALNTILNDGDVDDTPVDAATKSPVSSNWAYDHENAADPHTGYQKESEKGAASGYASLSASTKVVEDPANATATPTASKIPIADAGGKVDGWVSNASDTVPGKIEVATAAEVTTGTDAARAVSPDTLAGSGYGKRVVELALNGSVALTTADKAYFRVPSIMNGWNLVEVAAMVKGASSSGAVTLTVKNGATSMLTTNITIDQSEFDTLTAATAPDIDEANDGVATGNQIEVACSGAGVGVTYCIVELTFQLP